MPRIKCSCKGDCPGEVWFEGNKLWFVNLVTKETNLYLDANGLVELIKEAKKSLVNLTKLESEE